ncbi:S9 family peptidase [Metallosphaera hakonensis]|uniref:S9 family peptidase n=1 Tax=Metallosphaera hakonensis JCM 8857 = DSM 7519 TaxID=1293036 RepID=A0A2U9ISJ6_9CREN|nr:S9 family peptidase [Metallosphaera hakonensis]AWR98988.1 alpha/beta fold hydrolase [Metallosphaera hakonensis JCM 8857 = DSM 7519]
MNLSYLNYTPVLDFDINDGRIAYVILKDRPRVHIHGVGEVEIEEPESVHWIGSRLAVVADQGGSEVRSIYLIDDVPHPILSDGFDNMNPVFLKEDRFYFLSNRDKETIHLYLYDGGEITKVSKGKLPVLGICVSPGGRWVAYSSGIYDDDITLVDNKTGEEFVLSYPESEQSPSSTQCFTGDSLLFLSNHRGFSDIGKLSLRDHTVNWLVTSDQDKYEALMWKDKLVYTVDIRGDIIPVIDGKPLMHEGVARDLKVDRDLYFLASTFDSSADLFRYSATLDRITDSMKEVKGNFVRPRTVKYNSLGEEIDALLYERGNESRGVVYIHGGPDYECLNGYSAEIQMLVDVGFKVICPNYRGSTGRGRRFNHLNDKDLGGGDLRDVVESAKVLDVGKIAITGASYGGYLTMMAVTKYPEMWCSAAAVVPFVNWFTEKEKEREVLRQYDEVKIGNDEALLRERSPIFFLDRIKAPLLILAGENDPRCPAEETLQVVEEMKRLGRKIDYKIYENEGHGFSKRENLMDSVIRVVEFLDKNCKG